MNSKDLQLHNTQQNTLIIIVIPLEQHIADNLYIN